MTIHVYVYSALLIRLPKFWTSGQLFKLYYPSISKFKINNWQYFHISASKHTLYFIAEEQFWLIMLPRPKKHGQVHHFRFVAEGDIRFQDMKFTKVTSWLCFCRRQIIATYWWDQKNKTTVSEMQKIEVQLSLYTHSKRMGKSIIYVLCFHFCKITCRLPLLKFLTGIFVWYMYINWLISWD